MLRGSSDRYKSLWELTRDIALRALELAACQTAHWKKKRKKRDRKKEKSSELREEYKDRRGERGRGGRGGRASEGSRQVTDRTTFRFAFLLLFILHLLIFPAVH